MSADAGKVVVIGGGVIGAACAYYLAQAGWQVTLVERGASAAVARTATAASSVPATSCRWPCRGPLAGGALALSARFTFAIKPRFDPALWGWLLRFARRCNVRDMLAAGHGIQALLNSSRSLYDELMSKEPLDCEWQTRGLLFVFQTAAAMEHYAETDQLLRDSFGVPAKRYDGAALEALEPAFKPGLAGGWHYAGDAHLRPDKLMSSWRRVLETRGVALLENCEVRSFVREGGQARAVAHRRAANCRRMPSSSPPGRGRRC